jgi:hypothetical protein
MDRLGRSQERREFLKNGILGGVLLVSFPLLRTGLLGSCRYEANSLERGDFLDGSPEKIAQIVRQYGGEFGAFKGGW